MRLPAVVCSFRSRDPHRGHPGRDKADLRLHRDLAPRPWRHRGPGADALALNLTATQATGSGFLQVYPTGEGTPGTSSNLNTERVGQTIAYAAVVDLTRRPPASPLPLHRRRRHVAGHFTTDTGNTGPSLTGADHRPPEHRRQHDRDSWKHWIDADSDCQNTRHEVLIATSNISPVLTTDGCAVVSGSSADPYTGQTWTQATEVQIDHVVALANAHRSGGWAWTAAKKEAFANDMSAPELTAVGGDVNQAKSDSGPETWKPPLTSAWCDYATDWAAVKRKYALTVAQAEYNALAEMLATCDEAQRPLRPGLGQAPERGPRQGAELLPYVFSFFLMFLVIGFLAAPAVWIWGWSTPTRRPGWNAARGIVS